MSLPQQKNNHSNVFDLCVLQRTEATADNYVAFWTEDKSFHSHSNHFPPDFFSPDFFTARMTSKRNPLDQVAATSSPAPNPLSHPHQYTHFALHYKALNPPNSQ
jgi:hypothetical protein